MLARIWSLNGYRVSWVVLGASFAGVLALSAAAQPGRGARLTSEERAAVAGAQAKIVAADLQLDAEQTGKLVAAYAAFQKEAGVERPRIGRGDWEAMRAYQDAQQAKLAGSLAEFLDAAQAKAAAEVLAGFNRGWDRMVAVLLGFDLEEGTESEALGYTLAYIKAGMAARDENAGSRDVQAMREAMAAARSTLDAQLKPLLSEDQYAGWIAQTTWTRGDRDRGNRPPRGERPGRGDRAGSQN